MSMYLHTASELTANRRMMGRPAGDGANRSVLNINYVHASTSYVASIGRETTAINLSLGSAPTSGFLLFNTDTASSASFVHNNTTAVTNNTGVPAFGSFGGNSSTFTIGGGYTPGSGHTTFTATIKSATLGTALTSQQKTDLYNILTTYNTAIGRP
jgi:hypothetical protein